MAAKLLTVTHKIYIAMYNQNNRPRKLNNRPKMNS